MQLLLLKNDAKDLDKLLDLKYSLTIDTVWYRFSWWLRDHGLDEPWDLLMSNLTWGFYREVS